MEKYPLKTKSNDILAKVFQQRRFNSLKKGQRVKKISFKEFNSNNKNENEEESKVEKSNSNNIKHSMISNYINKIEKNHSITKEKSTSFTHIHRGLLLIKSPKKKSSPLKKFKNNFFQSSIHQDSYDSNIYKKRTTNLTKKKNKDMEFSFLEQPEIFNSNANTHIHFQKKKRSIIDSDDNDNSNIFSLTRLSHNNILKLNDISKDFKKTVIGYSKIKEIHSNGKTFLMEDIDKENNTEHNSIFSEIHEEKKIDIENYRMLQRIGKIYDSLDEEDIAKNNFYISPNNSIIIILDIIIAIFSVYNLIYIPFFLGINDIYCIQGSYLNIFFLLDIIIDIIFIIDNILPFFTAFYTMDDVLNTELKNIQKNYLKSYFIIDFLAAIPFKTLFNILDRKCNDIGYLNTPLYQNNIYYIVITLKLPKAIKAFNRNWLMEYIKNYLNQYEHFNVYLGLYENFLIFFAGLHIVSCIFIFIGKNQYPGWIIHFGFENKSFFGLYFIAIYYLITTVTTVGYGDLSCITPIEKVFGLFMEIVGIFAYSFALTSISNYVKVLSDKNEEFHQKCEVLDDIRVSYPELSDDLYTRIHRYLKSNLFNDKKDKKLIINSLPITLKNSLVYHMYEPIIKNFAFFKNFNNIDFIVRVILSFRPILVVKNDVLIKDGDFVEDIIFVKFGRLSLDIPILFEKEEMKTQLRESNTIRDEFSTTKNIFLENLMAGEEIEEEEEEKNDDEKFKVQYYKILDIQKNEHFGDILMFLNKRSPLRVKVKSRKGELFYLNKNDALEISTSFPQIWKKINSKSLFNWEQIKRLMNKVYKIFNKFHICENEEEQPIFLATSIIENTDLQSIPSLTEIELDEDDKTQIKLEKKRLQENTEKNREIKSEKSLNTIKESHTLESKEEFKSNIKSDKINFNSDINVSSIQISENKNEKSILTEKSGLTKKISEEEEEEKESEIDDFNDININKTFKLDSTIIKRKNDSERINQNFKSPKSPTPYKPNEINNEIYPNEKTLQTTVNPKIKLSTSNFHNLLKSKFFVENNNNISICSTEISFSINSEYENIDEISNYKYSKSLKLQNKVKNMLNENFERTTLKSNLKISKGIKKTSSVSFLDSELKNNATINSNANMSVNSNISKSNNSFLSKRTKSILSNNSSKSDKSQNTKKKRLSKRKNLLSEINQNMERNYMDLNDPNLFYSKFFQHYFDKKIHENDNLFTDLDEELVKKFNVIPNNNNKNISPLKQFNDMLKKI